MTRAQEAACVFVEEVGLAAYFVDRPARASGAVARLAFRHAGAPDHVVHDEAAADGVAAFVSAFLVAADVVDLADLDGLDVAVLGEARRDRFDVAPPVGHVAFDQHLGELDDQVGFARDPHHFVVELERGREVGGVAFGGSGAPPLVDGVDLPVVERHVVLEVLDADVLLDVPGRHGAHAVADLRAADEAARVGLDLVEVDEGHRGDAVVAVAADAGALEDGRDVAAEGDVVRHGAVRGRGRLRGDSLRRQGHGSQCRQGEGRREQWDSCQLRDRHFARLVRLRSVRVTVQSLSGPAALRKAVLTGAIGAPTLSRTSSYLTPATPR